MKRNLKKIIVSFLFLAGFSLAIFGQTKQTADQILEKAISAVTSTKGLTAAFSFSGGGQSGSGTLKSSGNKFTVSMPNAEIWYNGKELYTYNKKSRETTLIVPTMQELSESNPLLYVKSAKNGYTATFSSEKKAGKYIIDLQPKKKNAEMKKISITLRSSDNMPEKIILSPRSGGQIILTVSQIKTGQSLAASVFEYPKSKYPKAEIIDLR